MQQKSNYKGIVKIYSDGADKASMLAMAQNPVIKGLTTNPSLMKKAGISDYKTFCLDILQTIKDKPISFEVFSDEISEMEVQANEIKKWASNVYVKIPIINSKGISTIPLIKKLTQQGVKLNITAILTKEQAVETINAVKAGAPSIVSIFAGRIADTGRDPIPFMKEAADMCRQAGPEVELLWASTREVYNIVQAEECGCHIITVPPDLIKKMTGFNKDLFDVSLDTVQTFKTDSEAAGFKL